MKRLHKLTIFFILLALAFGASRVGHTNASPLFVPVVPSGLNGNGPGGVGTIDGSSNLELWLRPDRGVFTDAACSAAAVNGNAVYCWADQSGNGMNVIQATAINRPTYYTTTAANLINGQPTVRFDGAAAPNGDYFNLPASVIQGRTAFSFFTAVRWNGGNQWQRLWDFGSGTNNNGFVTVRSSDDTPRFAIKPNPNPAEQQLSFSTALPVGSGQLLDVIWNASGGTGWRNGNSQATRSAASWTPSNLGVITLHYIGRSIYPVDPYLNANIGEFIVYSSVLINTNRILVDNYLSSKYGVVIANDVYAGDTVGSGDFDLNVAGIGQLAGAQHTASHAAGIIVVNNTFLNANGDWLLFGHNTATNSTSVTDLPVTGTWLHRWSRNWYMDLTDAGTAGGTVDIIFDYSDSGLGAMPSYPVGAFRLLSRAGTSGAFSDVTAASGATVAIFGDQVQFLGVSVSVLDGQKFTLGVGDTIPPTVIGTVPANNDVAAVGLTQITVTFSEDVNDPAGDTDPDDVTNPANYRLINKGANGLLETASCLASLGGDDSQILPGSVAYAPNIATVKFASSLPVGSYRLFVCGTTSIVDLAGNALAGNGTTSGTDFTFDFTVGAAAGGGNAAPTLPRTGFAPGVVTRLPLQTTAYAKLGALWLEIPSVNVKTNIVGVPQSENAWDVKWLGNDAGWLNGTAFPSWVGNSVITAHVMGADGLPGPFAKLGDLGYGERVIVHMLDQQYVFEVRNKRMVRPDSTSFAFEHLEGASYLTLVTCSGYNEEKNTYSFRRLVRAVLVEVK